MNKNYQVDYLDNEKYNNEMERYKFKREFEFVTKNKIVNFSKVLDIAGGSGRLALPLSKFSTDITITDVSENAIRRLREKNSKIKAIHSDFTSAQITSKFSLVICIESISCFEDLNMFFSKVKSLMKNDGIFIFSCVNPKSWRYTLREIRHPRNEKKTCAEFTLNELNIILKTQNLEIIQIEGMNWIPLSMKSNSIFVRLFDLVEKIFFLNKWISQSPWLLISVKKSSQS